MKVTFNEKGIIITDVPIGTGVVNIKGLLKVLKEMKYNGVLAIEGENDSIDSAEFVRGAIRFVEENK